MRLEQILFSQGFGTRYDCRALICQGEVSIHGRTVTDPDAEIPTDGLVFEVHSKPWPYYEKAVVLLNKPSGYECSQKPIHHPSVMSLLPAPLRKRGVQPVGRLDEDTTGMLLLTDDGQLIHRLTHPKKHVEKLYRVQCKHPVTEMMLEKLLEGVLLDGERLPVKAQKVQCLSSTLFELSITQGKYHQVKRMVAAVGNRVVGLQRVGFGRINLPDNLGLGQWCFIDPNEI